MAYRIEFFNAKVQAEVLGWPAGIAASFTVIAKRMIEHGPAEHLRTARRRMKELQDE